MWVEREQPGFRLAARSSSSGGVGYCWLAALPSLEGRPFAQCHKVERGALLDADLAAYVLNSVGSLVLRVQVWLGRWYISWELWVCPPDPGCVKEWEPEIGACWRPRKARDGEISSSHL